jgi:N-acetylglucosaminyldiphosphoundecaprenol N-acetyl-beta-D-mannosaminyltransferase
MSSNTRQGIDCKTREALHDQLQFTNVIGTECLNTSPKQLAGLLDAYVEEERPTLSVDFTNVHIVSMRQTDPSFHEVTSRVDWFVPDSQVLKWAVNLRGGGMKERVYGPKFLDFAVRQCNIKTSHYFLGASQECLDLLLGRVRVIRPDINIVGSHNGYFLADQNDEVLADISKCNPDFIWVGLGTPRQQKWIYENKAKIKRGVLLAVGFAFDVNAGTKKDSPEWVGRAGLTWLYRLASEPRRLFGRYVYYNSVFCWSLLRQFIHKKHDI